MSKRELFISLANQEVYRGQMSEYKYPNSIPGYTRVPTKDELNAYFRAGGVAGYAPTVHWCGIFQVYLLQKAGVLCRWAYSEICNNLYDDPGLEITTGKDAQSGLQIGDVVKVRPDQHHLMVLDPVSKGFIRGVEGNAGGLKYPMLAINYMGNSDKNVVEEIQYRYRIVE
jgi:hypothetical protein